MLRYVPLIILISGAQAAEIVGQGLAEASTVAQGWRNVWKQATEKITDGTMSVDTELAAEAETLAEYYTHSPEELELLAHEMHESYAELLKKGDQVLSQSEEGKSGKLEPLKQLMAAGTKHMKTLEAMKRGTAAGQAFVESQAG